VKIPAKIAIWFAVLVTVLAAVAYSGSERILNGPLALSSAFSGLLALTGFMFTARTFITFKLNEIVYSNENYQRYIEDLKKDGAHCAPLYLPLKSLDSTLGRTCLFCFGTLTFLVVFALMPREWGSGQSFYERLRDLRSTESDGSITGLFVIYQLAIWLVYSSVLLSIIQVFWCIARVNKNIKSIISHWEDTYSEKTNMHADNK
jgi:hypothetical protein